MLADALQTLRTFEVFAAYRVAATPTSGLRSTASLGWDPPTGAEWDSATHTSRGLHARAEQLLAAVRSANLDPSLWRTQRDVADATHDLLDLGDALQAYRDRIDGLPPGDASGALDLLDAAWARWDGVATRWGAARAEPVVCG
jgi:hypothetical protein